MAGMIKCNSKLNELIVSANGRYMQKVAAMDELAKLTRAIAKTIQHSDATHSKDDLAKAIAKTLMCINQVCLMEHIEERSIVDCMREEENKCMKQLKRRKIEC